MSTQSPVRRIVTIPLREPAPPRRVVVAPPTPAPAPDKREPVPA
jgi:hypothetical protein